MTPSTTIIIERRDGNGQVDRRRVYELDTTNPSGFYGKITLNIEAGAAVGPTEQAREKIMGRQEI